MAKRQRNNGGQGKAKRFKGNFHIDPNTSGVYATCNRGKEQNCKSELMNLFSDRIEEYFDINEDELSEDGDVEETKASSIEEQINNEIRELNETKTSKKALLQPIELGCECLVFIKTRRPIKPEVLVENICRSFFESDNKVTRYTQKLTPVTYSATATLDEVKKLAKMVLKPHFHSDDQKPYKFAIQITKRNFNALPKPDIIKAIAETVGRDHGHSVDLKNFDKVILVECFKSNIGISVANDYEKFSKFNLQQIYEKKMTSDDTSKLTRVEQPDAN